MSQKKAQPSDFNWSELGFAYHDLPYRFRAYYNASLKIKQHLNVNHFHAFYPFSSGYNT